METQATISERRVTYEPAAIEPKWQQRWERDGLHRARIDPGRKKHYFLTMLPYPSGDLHIGHWYPMTPSDARARYLRMNGYNVMYPIGFDAFGLPAENAAIARNIHPKQWTYANIARMRTQLRSMGAMWDWERRGDLLRSRLLPLDAVVLSQAAGRRPGLPQACGGGLLPQLQHHSGARAGAGRGAPVRAL